MKLIKTTFFSSINTIVRIFAGLVSVKMIAVIIGPTGVALAGQLQSLQNILMNISQLGFKSGVTKYVAQFSKDQKKTSEFISTAFILTFYMTIIVSVILIIFAKKLGLYLFKTNDYDFIIYVLAITLLLYSTKEIVFAVLNGFKEIKKLISARIIATLLGLVITLILVISFELHGALLAIVFIQIIGFIVVIFFVRKQKWFRKDIIFHGINKKASRKLFNYSLMTIASILTLELRQIYLRDYIITKLSADSAGYWQAMWQISQTYISVITVSLTVYYLPRISEIKSKFELRKEIFYGYKIIIPVLLLMSSMIFLFRDLIIKLLFSSDFSAIKELFLFQLIGDCFKIAAWILSYIMVARAMTKHFIITEIIFKITFLAFSLYFLPNYGIIGLTYAYAINYFIYFFVMIFIFKKIIFLKQLEI